jgi:phenylalanyl-tRNA synthetase beta chain
MLISLSWLKDYVNIDGLSPEALSEALTNAGLEVESIETVGAKFTGVIVAEVKAVAPHPNADKLRLVTVDTGKETVQVVCGAPNVRPNIRIAFAQLGATVLNRKDGTSFQLTPAKIRGVDSCGMVCSIDELGLTEMGFHCDEDGIWPIQDITKGVPLGTDLKDALKLETEVILDTAPTANRGDLMSLMGTAREVAALFDRELSLPTPQPPSRYQSPIQLVVKLTDPTVCAYYAGAVIRNLKVGPSPDWLVKKLNASGIRSINNLVDITNLVMLETGQPLHAFDLTKLGSVGEVGVRRAQSADHLKPETLKTLDGVERTLTSESVVITLNNQPVALAGVMGGESTEVDDTTTSIFLECAAFPSATTRRSAKSVGLRSEASARFERGVDVASCKSALYRAIALYTEIAGGEYINLAEDGDCQLKPLEVPLRLSRMERILGITIPADQVQAILHKLGFQLKPSKEKDVWTVVVPSYRQIDVYREIDLIEEVVRVYGYDHIPYTLPDRTDTASNTQRQRWIQRLRSLMAGNGLNEVVTSSLIGDSLLEKTGFTINEAEAVKVSNSNSIDHTILRQSILPNLIEVAKFNQGQGLEQCWIFELGRTYFQKGKAPDRSQPKQTSVIEKLTLSGLIMGNRHQGTWAQSQKAVTDFYTAKGILERLFKGILPEKVSVAFQPQGSINTCHPGKCADVILDGKKVGYLGELHPTRQQALKFRQPLYVFELDMESLFKVLKQQQDKPQPIQISVYPSVKRDMAFSSPVTVSHQELLTVMEGLKNPIIRQIELFDEYRGAQVGEGLRSLAYRFTLQSDEETLTDEQIDGLMNDVRQTLQAQKPVQFR